jgi:hypothetical protein
MAPGYPPPIWRMDRRVESFADSEPVCVYLLCMELTCFAGLYNLSYILESSWPVEAMPEGLTNQCAGC